MNKNQTDTKYVTKEALLQQVNSGGAKTKKTAKKDLIEKKSRKDTYCNRTPLQLCMS